MSDEPEHPDVTAAREAERKAKLLRNEPDPVGVGGFRPHFLDPEKAATSKYIELDPDRIPDFHHYDNQLEPDPDPTASSLKPRHREIARLHALGKTNNQICEILGYSTSRISILLGTPALKAEVDRYRNRLYDQDLVHAIKNLGGDAVAAYEEALRGKDLSTKEKLVPATWVLEKLSGKAKQEINIESNTIASFMDELKRMKETGQTIDVTPITVVDPETNEVRQLTAPVVEAKFSKWIDDNV